MESNEHIAVNQADWLGYSIFQNLKSGTDMDGDGGFFWYSQPEFSDDELRSVKFEWKTQELDWKSCVPIDGTLGGFFPGHSWDRAVAGAFRIIGFVDGQEVDVRDVIFRALVPKELLKLV